MLEGVNSGGIIFIDGVCGYAIFKPNFRMAPSSSLVRTSASQAENTGSNPVGATRYHKSSQGVTSLQILRNIIHGGFSCFVLLGVLN